MIRLISVAAVLLCVPAQAQVSGPASVKPGELIELVSEGAGNGWMVLEPADLAYKTYEGGKYFVCGSGTRAQRITVICVSWDSRRIDRHVVSVDGGGTDVTPDPVIPPDGGYLGLTRLVVDKAPRSTVIEAAKRLSKIYASVAASVENGGITDIAAAQRAVIEANTRMWADMGRPAQQPWDAWAGAIQAKLESVQFDDVREVAKAYRAISAGLILISDGATGNDPIRTGGVTNVKAASAASQRQNAFGADRSCVG